MNDPISFDPERDLHHFLRLSALQVRSRIRQVEANIAQVLKSESSTIPSPLPAGRNKELLRLQLLEELIKEQLPNENIGAATGTSR
jgi:hypothetical protein